MKKKFSALVAMLLIVTMLFSGCSGGDTTTAEPESLPTFTNEGTADSDYDVIVFGSTQRHENPAALEG